MIIKVVSLNLWLGGILFDDILQFLKEQDADIVLLQEAYNGEDSSLDRQFRSMQVLDEHLNYPAQDFVADYRDFDRTEGKAQRGNAILSKFPITAREAIFFNNPYSEEYRDVPGNYHNCPRDLQYVALDTPAGELSVFNIQGVWDLDGDNFGEQRKQMSEAIIAAVRDKQNVILGGDTNARPTNQAIQNVEQYLTNIFGHELQSTFNMRRKDDPGYGTAVVDIVFVSPNIGVISKTCPDIDISDHLPLIATLEIPEKINKDGARNENQNRFPKYL